jgi:hypothetical protein
MDDFDLLNNFAKSISDGIVQAFGNPDLPKKITNSDILNYILNFLGYNNPNYLTKEILDGSTSGNITFGIKDPKSFMKAYLATFGDLNNYNKVQFNKETLTNFVPFILRDLFILSLSKVKSSNANKISIEDAGFYILTLEKNSSSSEVILLLGKMLLRHPTVAWKIDYFGNNKIVKKIIPAANVLASSYAVVPFNLFASAYIKLKIKKDLSGIFTDAERKYQSLFFMGLLNPEISNKEIPFSTSDMLLSNIDAGKCLYYGIYRFILAASYVLNILYKSLKLDIESLYSLPFKTFSTVMQNIFFDLYLNKHYINDVNNPQVMVNHFLDDVFLFPTSFTISNTTYEFSFKLPTSDTKIYWEVSICQYMNWINSINKNLLSNFKIKINDIFVNRSEFAKKYSELNSSLSKNENFTKFFNWQNKYLIGSVIATEIEQLVVYTDFYNEFKYIIDQYKTTGGKPVHPITSV